jgi:hypothetical protein
LSELSWPLSAEELSAPDTISSSLQAMRSLKKLTLTSPALPELRTALIAQLTSCPDAARLGLLTTYPHPLRGHKHTLPSLSKAHIKQLQAHAGLHVRSFMPC